MKHPYYITLNHRYKQEHKLSKMFYKHAGKTLKCIVSSATQVLGTGESGEKEDVVTENCADLLVRLLPIVMMVKYGTKGSVVRCVRSLSARI